MTCFSHQETCCGMPNTSGTGGLRAVHDNRIEMQALCSASIVPEEEEDEEEEENNPVDMPCNHTFNTRSGLAVEKHYLFW